MSDPEKNNGDPKPDPGGSFPIFRSEQTAVVSADGSVSSKVEKPAQNRESKLPEIISKLRHPDYSFREMARLIAIEIALVVQDIHDLPKSNRDPAAASTLRGYAEEVKALLALRQLVISGADQAIKFGAEFSSNSNQPS